MASGPFAGRGNGLRLVCMKAQRVATFRRDAGSRGGISNNSIAVPGHGIRRDWAVRFESVRQLDETESALVSPPRLSSESTTADADRFVQIARTRRIDRVLRRVVRSPRLSSDLRRLLETI